jgi:[protein-PII] uridylyltransferase
MRGLDNPRAQDELIGEKQAEARRLLAAGQVSQEAVTRLWINLSTDYFLYSSPEEIAWQTEAVLRATCAESPMVLVRHQTARGGTAVFICAPDQDGLFALTTALLSQLALNVVAARIQTADAGRTMNTFLVLEEDGSPVSGREREREIIDTLSRGLARRQPVEVGAPRRLPRQIRHFEIPARSEFSQDPANHRTVLHVTATDRPGLLSLVGQAFARTGVRIISAKIATVGALADDTFFITDLHGQPIEDRVQLDRIATALGEHLDGPARAA